MWIPIYITFMIFLVGAVLLLCYISTRKKTDVNKQIETVKNKKEKNFNQNHKQKGGYKKLFPNVMIDENDENVDDFDKAIDDMMFMDLMDED